MKNLDSAGTGAKEGIAIAVCIVFLAQHFGDDDIENAARRAGVGGFLDFHDKAMGCVIINYSDICDRFDKYIANNADVATIFALSGYTTKESMVRIIADSIGGRVKTTKWWRDNLKEIERTRRKMKHIQDVMNS